MPWAGISIPEVFVVNSDGEIEVSRVIQEVRISKDFDTVAAASTTAGIQEAIDDLPAAGGMVFIPSGTHSISTTINVNKPCIITGTVNSTIIYLADTSNVDVFTLPADQIDVTIRDLKIDGNLANNLANGNGIYATDGNLDCLFEGLEIQNCRDSGIHINRIATPPLVVISKCNIHDCVGVGFNAGIQVEYGDYCRIVDNIVDSCYSGIRLQRGIQTIISRNVCGNCGADGIVLASTTRSVIVSDNVCYSNTLRGISLQGITWDDIVIGNSCYLNTRSGIMIYRCNGTLVQGNTCKNNGNGYAGILVEGDGTNNADNNAIINNLCDNNTVQDYGVRIQGGADANDNIVRGNLCRGNDVESILDEGTRTVIDHNITS